MIFRKMKILLLDDFNKKLNGAENYFYNLIKLLRDKGHEVDFLFCSCAKVRVSILGSLILLNVDMQSDND